VAKSVRTISGLGGRPTGQGVRHKAYQNHDPEQTDVPTDNIPDELDDIREEIRKALVGNLPMISKWFELIGRDDPKGALTMFRDFTEFVLPKLQRTDSKIDPSSPVQLVFESIEAHKKRMAEKQKSTP
jgi:hypothetical protein